MKYPYENSLWGVIKLILSWVFMLVLLVPILLFVNWLFPNNLTLGIAIFISIGFGITFLGVYIKGKIDKK